MKKRGIKIGQKITLGFAIIIFVFALNAIYSVLTVNQNGKLIEESRQTVDPSLDGINEFILLVTRSKTFITNWVYLQSNTQSNTEDKEALKRIHKEQYPELKERIMGLMTKWKDSSQINIMDSTYQNFEDLLKVQNKIMNTLVTFEDYDDPTKKFEAEDAIENDVLPMSANIIKKLEVIAAQKRKEKTDAQELQLSSSRNLTRQTLIIGVILTIIGIGIALYITGSIVSPIRYINQIISQLATGELPEDKSTKFSNDEIGEMAESMDKLVSSLRSTSGFAENIGKGSYNASFQPLSEKDVLGNALIEMRNNLSRVAEEERRRGWTTGGIAKFSEIIRENNEDIATLSDKIISNLVKYLNANQGGLFILYEEDAEEGEEADTYLYLAACYAWDKKKYIEQKVYKGEGLAGQAWQEQATIYLTEVPNDYVMITSGLGEANPTSVLIVPLKINEQTFGVIELASFNEFETYEIEFAEKIAESIASALLTVRNADQTQKLLEESNALTEQMMAQEEDMRLNLEELNIAQQEMLKTEREAKEKEAIFNSTKLIIEIDTNFTILDVNDLTEELLNYESSEMVGMSMARFFESEGDFNIVAENLVAGERWSHATNLYTKYRDKIFVKISGGAFHDEEGNVLRYVVIIDDISVIAKQQ